MVDPAREQEQAAGGLGRPEGLNRGYYVRPTIFANVGNDARINQEEIFGPVMSIMPFDTEEEAIAIANANSGGKPHGLSANDRMWNAGGH